MLMSVAVGFVFDSLVLVLVAVFVVAFVATVVIAMFPAACEKLFKRRPFAPDQLRHVCFIDSIVFVFVFAVAVLDIVVGDAVTCVDAWFGWLPATTWSVFVTDLTIHLIW